MASSGSEKKRRIEQEKKKETAIGFAIVLLIVIALAGGAAWYFVSNPPGSSSTTATAPTGDPTLTICLTDATPLAEHIHPHLEIAINGQPLTIPANIGISATCQRPVHTHDASGEIHIESPVVYPYTLHDFFLVWGEPFDNTQVFQYKVDSSHFLRMTVNGLPNGQFENYVMQDHDQIVITYGPST